MIHLTKYSIQYFEQWDDFVLTSKNGTLFHTRKFLSYHPENKWVDSSLLFTNEKDKIIAVFPACLIENKIISHQGASSGGLIVGNKNTIDISLEIIDLLIEHYKSHEIVFRKHEYIFDTNPAQEVEFAAQYKGFKVDFVELSSCVDLQATPNYSKNTKSKINRSSDKIEIKFDDDNYDDFYQLLTNNLSHKHKTEATHSLDEIKKLKELFPNNYFLVSAYKNDIVIASVWLLKANDSSYHTFYIALNYEYKSLYPLYTLIDSIIKHGKDHNINYLNFGISTENRGTIINKGLFNFKDSFGAFGVIRSMYSYKN